MQKSIFEASYPLNYHDEWWPYSLEKCFAKLYNGYYHLRLNKEAIGHCGRSERDLNGRKGVSLEVVHVSSWSFCNCGGRAGAPESPGPGRAAEKTELPVFPTSVTGKFIEQREAADTKAEVLYSSGWRQVVSLSFRFSNKLDSFDWHLERLFVCSHAEPIQLLQFSPEINKTNLHSLEHTVFWKDWRKVIKMLP